jgi:hypothetical protein
MKDSTKAILGLTFFAVVNFVENRTSKYSFGGPSIIRDGYEINRNPNLLVPEFAGILEKLFQNLRQKGFDPHLWEGYRTPERAKYLAEQGTGIEKSLHIEGRAADIISKKDFWSNSEFFAALGNEALKLGLVWGGNFKNRKDFPHVEYHG